MDGGRAVAMLEESRLVGEQEMQCAEGRRSCVTAWLPPARRKRPARPPTRQEAQKGVRVGVRARYGSPHTGVTNHGSNPIDWNEDVTRAAHANYENRCWKISWRGRDTVCARYRIWRTRARARQCADCRSEHVHARLFEPLAASAVAPVFCALPAVATQSHSFAGSRGSRACAMWARGRERSPGRARAERAAALLYSEGQCSTKLGGSLSGSSSRPPALLGEYTVPSGSAAC